MFSVVLDYEGPRGPLANVLYANTTDPHPGPDPTAAQYISQEVSIAWIAHLQDRIVPTYTLRGVRVSKIDGTEMFYTTTNQAGTYPATTSPDPYFQGSAVLVKKNVAGSNRGGRLFHPVPTEGYINQGGVLNSGVVTLSNAYNAWKDALEEEEITLYVRSMRGGWVVPMWLPITSFEAQATLASQRRRMRRGVQI